MRGGEGSPLVGQGQVLVAFIAPWALRPQDPQQQVFGGAGTRRPGTIDTVPKSLGTVSMQALVFGEVFSGCIKGVVAGTNRRQF